MGRKDHLSTRDLTNNPESYIVVLNLLILLLIPLMIMMMMDWTIYTVISSWGRVLTKEEGKTRRNSHNPDRAVRQSLVLKNPMRVNKENCCRFKNFYTSRFSSKFFKDLLFIASYIK